MSDRGITLSTSQVYRLVEERAERLSLKILMALLDLLDCTMDDLIEPVAATGAAGISDPSLQVSTIEGKFHNKWSPIPRTEPAPRAL
ncbi:helix-turn-helix transcriptional regulator [Streptomyces sp. NPDC048484]|uniref:helix-turn-helix domain-containing protein n=1 Tax=Streptomyces sp. NPDC048484 TaxID=3155146 RepID=UPI0034295ABE